MEAENLQKVFSESFYRIPDYQRGYAWGKRQLNELWDDLQDIIIEDGVYKKHYTGTLFVEKTSPVEDEKWLLGSSFYNIVDGQQRITTISILLFELLRGREEGYSGQKKDMLIEKYLYSENESKNSKVYKFSYVKEDKNYPYLLNKIFEDKTVLRKSEEINKYSKNLSEAKVFFFDKLKEMSNTQKEELFIKVTTSLYFDIRKIEKDLDVQAVFETINNRGKPLSVLEKLKNRLIYLTDKLHDLKEDKRNLRTKINTAWGMIYTYLGSNPEYLLDEDEFLSAHLSLYRKPKDAVYSEKLAEEKVFQMFSNRAQGFDLDESGKKEPEVDYKKIDHYISGLCEAAPIWFDIHNTANNLIKKILTLNSGKEVKVFLLALLRYKVNNEEFDVDEILDKVERIMFRNRVVWVFDERTFATWGRKIYNNEEVHEVLSEIEDLISHKIDEEEIIGIMNNLFTYQRGNKGFHRWATLKYFLFEYDEELRERYNEDLPKILIENYDDTTIEHIVPRDYLEFWPYTINNIITGMDDEQSDLASKVIINSLGNLTILKGGKNSSLGNRGWDIKKGRFSTGSYNEIDISRNTDWTITQIYKRGLDLVNFLEKKIGGVKFDDSQRLRLLFYEDYIINKVL